MSTATRPPFRPLRLTAPRRMGDRDGNRALVQAVQEVIAGYGIEQDGVYGPRTAMGASLWKERAGAPTVHGALSVDELVIMLGHGGYGYARRPLPREWIRRRDDPARRAQALDHRRQLARLAAAERPPATQTLRIIAREQWCTVPRGGISVVRHAPGVPHVVHWFGPGTAATDLAGGIAQVNGFARYHRYDLGWVDLGYNWAILRDGHDGQLCTVLEGRGRNVRGAHSGHNVANTYPGVLVLCGTSTPAPTREQLLTLQALRTAERWGRRHGHIEFFSTTCPGPVLWPWVQTNR